MTAPRPIPLMDNVVTTFATPFDLFEAVFGPSQRDSHVLAWKAEQRYAAFLESKPALEKSRKDFVAEVAENQARRIAETHHYDVALLEREHAMVSKRVALGLYGAAAHARQITRAIEIATERNDDLAAAAVGAETRARFAEMHDTTMQMLTGERRMAAE